MSKLYFRYGAMNSGKSTSLMQVAYNYEERGMKVKVVKPKIDEKGGNKLISRLGVIREADFVVSLDENIFDIIKESLKEEDISCILVDEAQFLKAKQIDQLLEVAILLDVPVICYGLRTDFQRKGFPGSERLLLIAHSIEELKTICACGKKAVFNGRKIKDEFVFEGDQVAIEIGEEITYESLCGNCYYKFKEKYDEKKVTK